MLQIPKTHFGKELLRSDLKEIKKYKYAEFIEIINDNKIILTKKDNVISITYRASYHFNFS